MSDPAPLSPPPPAVQRPVRRALLRAGWHLLALVLALAALAAYLHFKVEGPRTAALFSLVAAGVLGFVPLRDLLRLVLRVEGPVLHVVHVLGALALAVLPLSGAVSGLPVLTHSAMAPFAIMGAAQALMHQDRPRNAQQAEALRQFVASFPELAAIGSPAAFRSPAAAQRAVTALTDILAKAQVLGQTELDADPGFQAALRRTSTRVGLSLALDAVESSLDKMPATSASASAIHALRTQLASARAVLAQARASQ